MTSKERTQNELVAGGIQKVLSNDPSMFLIVPADANSSCFIANQRHNFQVCALRVTCKDQDKVFTYTEKDMPFMLLLYRENFVDRPDSFLAVGRAFTPIWSSVLPDVEFDLTAFAVGTEGTSKMLGLRAYFPRLAIGAERKNAEGFVVVTCDPRVIADWAQRIKLTASESHEQKIERSEIGYKRSEGRTNFANVDEKDKQV